VQGRGQGQHRAGRERGAEERAERVRRRARVLPRGEFDVFHRWWAGARPTEDVSQENLTVDLEERTFRGTPQNSFHKAVNVPDVVVFPRYLSTFFC
jgi:hypothetical protein